MTAWLRDQASGPRFWRCSGWSRPASWWRCRPRRARHVSSSGSRSMRWCAPRRRRLSSPSAGRTGTSPRPPMRKCVICSARRPGWRSADEAGAVPLHRWRLSGCRQGSSRTGCPPDEALFGMIGDARLVLIGEGSDGCAEFYAARAHMTRRLIEQRGFCAVAVEADWPDAYRVNRFVRGRSEDATAEEALRGFQRLPTWMWRNTVLLDFVGWLREHDDRVGVESRKAGFYGLDLHSLHWSMEEVISYLQGGDPPAAARARDRYFYFDHASGDDGQSYGFAAAFRAGE